MSDLASSPRGAIVAALRAQSRALLAFADVLEQAPAEQPSKYIDQYTSPIPRRTYLAHARRGAFPTRRVGKRVLAERDVFEAWLSSQPTRATVPAAPASGPRDVDAEALSELGLRRAGGR